MTYDQGVALIREFGFPTVVVMWFMFRMEKRVDRLFELMSSLMTSTKILAIALQDHRDELRANGSSARQTPLPPPDQPPCETEENES